MDAGDCNTESHQPPKWGSPVIGGNGHGGEGFIGKSSSSWTCVKPPLSLHSWEGWAMLTVCICVMRNRWEGLVERCHHKWGGFGMVPYTRWEHRGQTHTSSICSGVNESELQWQAQRWPLLTLPVINPRHQSCWVRWETSYPRAVGYMQRWWIELVNIPFLWRSSSTTNQWNFLWTFSAFQQKHKTLNENPIKYFWVNLRISSSIFGIIFQTGLDFANSFSKNILHFQLFAFSLS